MNRYAGRSLGIVTVSLSLLSAVGQTNSGDSVLYTVHVDKVMGTLKPLRGVNGPPDMSYRLRAFDSRIMRRPKNISDAYRKGNVTSVRTHDAFGAGDIDSNLGSLPVIQTPVGGFPVPPIDTIYPDLSADPALEKSYNFVQSDLLIKGIRAIGADVIFRIGRTGGTTAPPPDPARYADIVRHVVLHYNKGWANGFHNSVKYWEVWNEPDFGPIWWRGTPEQFFDLYAHLAAAVKTADPSALVGGPTIAADNNVQPYREGFLDYVKAHKLPLDFFSWHHYADADDPWDFTISAREIRRLLNVRGFTNTLSVLDEWNSNVQRSMNSVGVQHAAFVTASRIYMQDAPIDLDGYYRADSAFGGDGHTPSKTGLALEALGRMAQTPERLATMGGDDKGQAIEAARTADGKLIQILISNYEIPINQRAPRSGPDELTLPGLFTFKLLPRRSICYSNDHGYDLSVEGLKSGRHYTVERYRIADSQNFELMDRASTLGPRLHLAAFLPAPSVEFIVLREDVR